MHLLVIRAIVVFVAVAAAKGVATIVLVIKIVVIE